MRWVGKKQKKTPRMYWEILDLNFGYRFLKILFCNGTGNA